MTILQKTYKPETNMIDMSTMKNQFFKLKYAQNTKKLINDTECTDQHVF